MPTCEAKQFKKLRKMMADRNTQEVEKAPNNRDESRSKRTLKPTHNWAAAQTAHKTANSVSYELLFGLRSFRPIEHVCILYSTWAWSISETVSWDGTAGIKPTSSNQAVIYWAIAKDPFHFSASYCIVSAATQLWTSTNYSQMLDLKLIPRIIVPTKAQRIPQSRTSKSAC